MDGRRTTTLVPSQRMLYVTAATLLPLFLIEALHPEWLLVILLLSTLYLAFAVADYFLSRKSLVSLSLHFPEIVRLQKGRENSFPVELVGNIPKNSIVRIAIDWPESFQTKGDYREISFPESSQLHRFAWPIVGQTRGAYLVRRAVLERGTRFGLWSMRTTFPMQTEIRVYPDLMSERHAAAALFLNRGSIGNHIIRQPGKGSEFEKLREYQAGDSFGEIHWKASARRGKLTTKVFQTERTQEIYVIIDGSRLSARGSAMESFISSALLLAMAAERQGDLFGLLTFDSSIQTFLRAKSGPGHFDSCRDALYTLQPAAVSPDYSEVCTFIRSKIRKRALLFILTSLDDPVIAEDFTNAVPLLSQHLIIVNMLRPPGVAPLFSGLSAETLLHAYEQLAGHLHWADLRQLELRLKRDGVHFHLLAQANLSIQLIRQYIEVKSRGKL